jgi:hypothetical protein
MKKFTMCFITLLLVLSIVSVAFSLSKDAPITKEVIESISNGSLSDGTVLKPGIISLCGEKDKVTITYGKYPISLLNSFFTLPSSFTNNISKLKLETSSPTLIYLFKGGNFTSQWVKITEQDFDKDGFYNILDITNWHNGSGDAGTSTGNDTKVNSLIIIEDKGSTNTPTPSTSTPTNTPTITPTPEIPTGQGGSSSDFGYILIFLICIIIIGALVTAARYLRSKN